MTQTEQFTSSFLNFMQRFVIAKVINLISQILNEMKKKHSASDTSDKIF